MKNKFVSINRIILFYIILYQSIAFSSDAMDIVKDTTVSHSSASCSSYGANLNVSGNFLKIIEVGLGRAISLKNPNALIEYFKAQYGNQSVNLVEVLSTLALNFSQLNEEGIKSMMRLLTNYVSMSTDSLATHYDAKTSENGVGLKILDRMTALVRKQKIHGVGGRIYFANGSVFGYEEMLKAAAKTRASLADKNLETSVCVNDIEY